MIGNLALEFQYKYIVHVSGGPVAKQFKGNSNFLI